MEKFDSDKRYHVLAIVLIDIKKQTELFLITMSYLNISCSVYWKLSCCIENSLKIFYFVNYILQTKWFILQARFLY